MCKPHKQNNYGERAATKREAEEEIDEQEKLLYCEGDCPSCLEFGALAPLEDHYEE